MILTWAKVPYFFVSTCFWQRYDGPLSQPNPITQSNPLMSFPKNIVVLGATGNIGTALVHELLKKGHHVTAVARPSARLDALAQAGATAG